MSLETVLPPLMPLTFIALLVLERLTPARPQRRVRRWLVKGLLFFVMVAALNAIVPAVLLTLIGGASLLHLSGLGTLGGALLVVLLSDLFGYWVHRGLHTWQPVWRWTHQMHHSAERLDMAGSAYFHPFDSLFQQVLPGVALMMVLGVTPEAGALAGFLGFVLGVTPHLNVRTPAWLGYVFQRPEMHAVHHTRGVHAYNYGVLAWSDMLFGTWRNPARFHEGEFGFWDGASATVGRMLVGRDVGRAPAEPIADSRAA